MYSQDQSTNFSRLQLQMESLQGWADELTKNGKGKDLLDLLAALPLFHKLSGLGMSISITIDTMGQIELTELEELAKTVPSHINEIEQEAAYDESSSSSQDQSLLTIFQRSICQEVSTYYGRLKEEGTSLGTLNIMSKALSAFVDNASSKFVGLMEKIGASEIQRQGFDLYQTYQKQVVRSQLDCVVLAIKEIERNLDRQVRKDRLIVAQQTSQMASYRIQKKNENKHLAEKSRSLKEEEAEKPAGKKPAEKVQRLSVKLPDLPPHNQKKQGKSKPKD